MTSLTSPARPDALLSAVTGLLEGKAPLPEQVFTLSQQLLAQPGEVELWRLLKLRQALAAHPSGPLPLLTELAERADVAGFVLSNPSAPAPLRRRAAEIVDDAAAVRLASDSTDADVLAVLCRRALAAPRAQVRSRWEYSNHGDSRHPAPACRYEHLASLLLRNAALPVLDGRALANFCISTHLPADLDEAGNDEYDRDGENSITLPGVHSWLRRDRQFAFDVAQDSTHPWVLGEVALRSDAPERVRVRAFWTLLAPVLTTEPDGRRVPIPTGRLAAGLARRLPPAEAELLATWLRSGWDLAASHTGLAELAYPPPPPPAASGEQSDYRHGPLEEVVAQLEQQLTLRTKFPRSAGAAVLARADIPTELALRVARACDHLSLEWLQVRAFDGDFTAAWAAQLPGRWPQLIDAGDVEIVLAAICLTAATLSDHGGAGMAGFRDLVIGQHPDRGPFALLGEHALRLPWPVLARLAGVRPDVDAAVAAALADIVDQPGGLELLPAAAAAHDGAVAALRAALLAALS